MESCPLPKRHTFFKYTHIGVYIERRRGSGAQGVPDIDTLSHYMDEPAPLMPGTPNDEWTDVAKMTVSQ